MTDESKKRILDYREPGDPNAGRLEGLRKQIEAEGKIPIQLPENLEKGQEIKELDGMNYRQKENLEKYALYSAKMGILYISHVLPNLYPSPGEGKLHIKWANDFSKDQHSSILRVNEKNIVQSVSVVGMIGVDSFLKN